MSGSRGMSDPRLLLAVCVLAAIGVAACGGGGTETVTQVRTQTSASPLTKAEFIAQADAICQQYQGISDEISKKLERFRGRISSQDTAGQVADLFREGVDQLRPDSQLAAGVDFDFAGAYFISRGLAKSGSREPYTDRPDRDND